MEEPTEDERNKGTQAVGLVAVHLVAEALRDEHFHFAWLLRREAFLRFGYDPDAVFSEKVDEYGFGKQGRAIIPGANLLGSRAFLYRGLRACNNLIKA